MNILDRIKHSLKAPRCEECKRALYCYNCGSYNVKFEGWDGHNHRHYCKDCGFRTWFDGE